MRPCSTRQQATFRLTNPHTTFRSFMGSSASSMTPARGRVASPAFVAGRLASCVIRAPGVTNCTSCGALCVRSVFLCGSPAAASFGGNRCKQACDCGSVRSVSLCGPREAVCLCALLCVLCGRLCLCVTVSVRLVLSASCVFCGWSVRPGWKEKRTDRDSMCSHPPNGQQEVRAFEKERPATTVRRQVLPREGTYLCHSC